MPKSESAFFISAPQEIKNIAAVSEPWYVAQCSGVLQALSFKSKLRPYAFKYTSTYGLSPWAAVCMGVNP